MNCLDRRLELLRMEGLGFSKPEVVKELTQKFQCSKQLVYYDYVTRAKWQPSLQDLDAKNLMLKIYNRSEYIYRKASYMLLQSQNENAQIGALRCMLAANEQLIELVKPQGDVGPEKIGNHETEFAVLLEGFQQSIENAARLDIESAKARLTREVQP